jgi:alkanesulfonate monooxygenase
MDVGIAPPTFATDGWIAPPERLLRMARRAEDLGFSGLWACEHLAHPPGRGYSRLAPLTTIATFAGATDVIGVEASVLLRPLRQAVWAERRKTTRQHMAEGRSALGLGTG